MTGLGRISLVELQTLFAESKGEWEHLEFKKFTGELQGRMETLCGFLNGTGGKVLFGVTNARWKRCQEPLLPLLASIR
jgi:predicted HTH transcriptional regulator